jgi:hypothetical protein
MLLVRRRASTQTAVRLAEADIATAEDTKAGDHLPAFRHNLNVIVEHQHTIASWYEEPVNGYRRADTCGDTATARLRPLGLNCMAFLL